MRTIRVTGRGRIRLTPDLTRITLTLTGVFPAYDEAMRRSAEAAGRVTAALAPFGFDRSDLKTLRFAVDTEYESFEEDGCRTQRFAGYRYDHELKVEFDSDNELLGKLLYALSNCGAKPEIRLSFTVKDAEKAKNELLSAAVADAKAKAVVLTREAGVSLKYIRHIIYAWDRLDLEVRPMVDACLRADAAGAAKEEAFRVDIAPDDVEVADAVTVVWEIG